MVGETKTWTTCWTLVLFLLVREYLIQIVITPCWDLNDWFELVTFIWSFAESSLLKLPATKIPLFGNLTSILSNVDVKYSLNAALLLSGCWSGWYTTATIKLKKPRGKRLGLKNAHKASWSSLWKSCSILHRIESATYKQTPLCSWFLRSCLYNWYFSILIRSSCIVSFSQVSVIEECNVNILLLYFKISKLILKWENKKYFKLLFVLLRSSWGVE